MRFSVAGLLLAPRRATFRPLTCRAAAAGSSQLQHEHRLFAASEEHTRRLAQLLAEGSQAGDCICLYGDVGAGKSFFRCGMAVPAPQQMQRRVAFAAAVILHLSTLAKMPLLGACSREFIRAAYGDPYMPVPSPTYLLQNIYDELEGG